ncbi:MAG: SDR family NAD(P)-dependent oxidoreductase [Methyloligellaceae bacterium]
MQTKRRIAIVGGCGGIGRALVSACLETMNQVAVLDLKSSAQRHPAPKEAHYLEIDVLDRNSVFSAFADLSKLWYGLDGLVNLSGFMADMAPILETDASDIGETIEGNLISAFSIVQAAHPLLKNGVSPVIVQTSSGLAAFTRPQYGSYAAAKAGLISLTKTLAIEWAPDIRVNAVAPGAIDTAFLRGGTGRSPENQPTSLDIPQYEASIPLKRIGTPGDVIGPILFLLGEESAYMTGQVLWVNGGAYMP